MHARLTPMKQNIICTVSTMSAAKKSLQTTILGQNLETSSAINSESYEFLNFITQTRNFMDFEIKITF
jgi:hypothetical protein